MSVTDSTTERRDLLAVLLSRFERGVITDQERPLLRPLVEAEMATLDQSAAALGSDGLREKYAVILREFAVLMIQRGGRDLDELTAREAGSILAIHDRRMEQLAAGRETWKAKALEIEQDRDRIAAEAEQLRQQLDAFGAPLAPGGPR